MSKLGGKIDTDTLKEIRGFNDIRNCCCYGKPSVLDLLF